MRYVNHVTYKCKIRQEAYYCLLLTDCWLDSTSKLSNKAKGIIMKYATGQSRNFIVVFDGKVGF